MRQALDYNGVAGEAYVVVRERILRGDLAIGQVISRRKMAAELAMPLPAVADALRRLEDEGHLESRPRAGTRVRLPNEQDVRGHYLVREALEVQAAWKFADVAGRADKAELIKLATRVDTLASEPWGDRFLYLSLHERFHRRIAECTRYAALCEAIDRTSALSSTWLCGGRFEPGIKRNHQVLAKALMKGPEIASVAMREHIRCALENTLRRLQPYFEQAAQEGPHFVRGSRKPRRELNRKTG